MTKAQKKSSRQRMTYRRSAQHWKDFRLNMFARKVGKDLQTAEGAARVSQGKLQPVRKNGAQPRMSIRSLVDSVMRRKTGER
jgi:hypothetical protein